MKRSIKEYKTLVFDCDGVLLNSNKIKTEAFYKVTKHFGQEFAQALVDYHIANGGMSRYLKFDYFITHILQKPYNKLLRQELLKYFAKNVKKGLMTCEVADGIELLKAKTEKANWIIISGSDQAELRKIFKERNLEQFFKGGIFGSPDRKDEIIEREIGNMPPPWQWAPGKNEVPTKGQERVVALEDKLKSNDKQSGINNEKINLYIVI